MQALDGDTLAADGREIDLFGIDAPELEQDYRTPNGTLHCGLHAAAALGKMVGGSVIRCNPVNSKDRERQAAVCHEGINDLSAWIVLQSWAVAARHQSYDYVGAEKAAREARRNLLRTKFVPPWKWRDRKRLP